MRKKVCHITSVHNRYDTRIFYKECVSLAKNGYDVTLIVNDDKEDEYVENVKIVSTKFKPKNRFERIINSKNKIYKKATEVNADIYHFHDPELIPVGIKLKRKNKKVIFDAHEDTSLQIKDKQWIPKLLRNIIARLYSLYEINSAKKFDAIISVTPHIVEKFLKANKNTVMITNYPIIDIIQKVERNPSNTICFAGGISRQWNHDKILKAIEGIEGITYLIAGNGTKEYLDSLRSLSAWNKVQYKGKVPHSEVKNIYAQSIAGMALNYSNQAKKEGTLGNTKLFEYMAAELPVICSNYKLWREIIEQYDCGICVDPNNIEEIKKAIKFILNNPEKAKVMGKNGRKAVMEKYNWGTQEKILLDLYEKL